MPGLCVWCFPETGNLLEEIESNLYLREAVYMSYWPWFPQ